MHAMDSLELVKKLDDTRVVMLNSGRFDGLLFDGPPGTRQLLPEAWVRGQTLPGAAGGLQQVRCRRQSRRHGFPAGAVALHVGPVGEPAVLRFVAPADGDYRVTARFTGIAGPPANGPITTGSVAVVAHGQTVFSDKINCDGRPNEAAYEGQVTLQKGDGDRLRLRIGQRHVQQRHDART